MLAHKFLKLSFASFFALTFPILTSLNVSSIAQRRSAPLVQFPMLNNANCQYITSGIDYDFSAYGVPGIGRPYARVEASPIISRQVYNSDFQLRATSGSYTALACDINTDDFDMLTLQMGVMDASADRNEKLHVKIYQSGTVVSNRPEVSPGEVIDFIVDLKNTQYQKPGNISVELTCENSTQNYGCILYFIEAELYPTGNYLSQQSSEWRQDENVSERSVQQVNDSNNDSIAQEVTDDISGALSDLFNRIFD